MATIRQSTPVAKKQYRCDAWYWIDYTDYYDELTPEEQKQYDNCNGVIRPGEKYLYEFQNASGDVGSFRANLAMHDICLKYDLYPDD